MKPLRVLTAVVEVDLPAIVAYHAPKSLDKAQRIVTEYDDIVAKLQDNPRQFAERKHRWRVALFRQGTYSLYYSEMPDCWLVAGIFHSARDPDWVLSHLLIREVRDGNE